MKVSNTQIRLISVNTEENASLIYDFYGFPTHYYKQKYPNRGSKKIAEQVISLLQSHGIKASGTDRGLDHGIWVPFKVAFDPEENPLQIPIIQGSPFRLKQLTILVSLFDNDSVDDHLKLGHALSSLRDQNIMIIGGGMTVHNLRASMPVVSVGAGDHIYPFTPTFNDATVKAATLNTGEKREEDVRGLYKREDLRLAHPSLEHLMPLVVCCGAAGEDKAECLFKTVEFGALGWASFCFGGIPDADKS